MPKVDSNTLQLSDIAGLLPKPVTAFVELPSKGNFYDKNIVKDGKVELAPMSAREEKLIAGMRGNNVDDVIDMVLNRCLKTKLNPDDLLVTDRFFILLALRANSYGEDYNFDLTCGSCDKVAKYTVKIPNDLKMKWAKDTDLEPFEITLPVSKLNIGFRLMRGKDTKDVKRYITRETKQFNVDGDPGYLYRLAKQIVSVNGKNLDIITALELVSRLPAKDSAFMKNAFDKKTPGVLTAITKECVGCGRQIVADLPMSAEFFRPDDSPEDEPDGDAVNTD